MFFLIIPFFMNFFNECQTCRKRFKNQFSLRRHISVVHNGYRPHECECGRSFATGEQLARHMNSKHTFEKPYACQRGCEKAFASYTARDYHHKVKHEEVKYTCFCGKSYSSKVNLKNHMAKPHVCPWPQYYYVFLLNSLGIIH